MLLEPIVQHTDNFPFLSKLIHNIKQTKDAQDEGDEEQNKVYMLHMDIMYAAYVYIHTYEHMDIFCFMHTYYVCAQILTPLYIHSMPYGWNNWDGIKFGSF